MTTGNSAKAGPLSEGGGKKGAGCLYIFGGIFLLIGLGVMIAGIAWPAVNIVRAQSWVETPCTIISSTVETNSSSDGDTYRIAITYGYRFDGRSYTGDRYDFSVGSSSGYDGKQRIVSEYPPNSETVCYVNPNKPAESVIHRGFSLGYLWFGLFGAVFAVVGGGLIGGAVYANRKADRADFKTDWLPNTSDTVPASGLGGGREITLKPRTGPVGKLIGIVVFCAIWNGMLGFFIYEILIDGDLNAFSVVMGLFLIPFVLVGLFLIAAAVQQLLTLFNPRPVLTASTNTPRLGETVNLRWKTTGAVGAIQVLTVTLVGREVAVYQRGTDTITEREKFAELLIGTFTAPDRIRIGNTSFTIPAEAMHSFDAEHNKVEWFLEVKGEIKRWPDAQDEYPLIVLPTPIGESTR